MKTICPHCKQEYPETPNEYLGMTLQCQVCHKVFVCMAPQAQYFVAEKHKLSNDNIAAKNWSGKLIKYTFAAVITAFIVWAVWYNLPSNRKKRADKEIELKHIETVYMVKSGETDDFREEVRRLQEGYPRFGGNATQADYIRSVEEIIRNWNAAVRGFKNADKKMFHDVDSLVIVYAYTSGGGAYQISKDFDLPARILLIQKSQSEAAEIGKRIYEAAKDDDLEEKEKLLKEYDRLINLGNLQK